MSDVEAELIPPAVEGTKSILRACHANRVRRLVITSSIATIIYPSEKPAGLTNEEVWSDLNHPKMLTYHRSKQLAERAAWDFQAGLPEDERFELVTILPSFIMGPALRTEAAFSVDFCRNLLNGVSTKVLYG